MNYHSSQGCSKVAIVQAGGTFDKRLHKLASIPMWVSSLQRYFFCLLSVNMVPQLQT